MEPASPPPPTLPLVRQHLPGLDESHLEKLAQLAALVRDWNARVNLVSRKDVDHLEEHHLLHSLLVTRVLQPAAGASLVDLGTGGGFPGLPLAIVFPQCRFTLFDSVAKKGRAVADMAAALGLTNARVIIERAEKVRDRFDFVLGRAVAALPEFLGWALPRLRSGAAGAPGNGVLYFKGTLWREELADAGPQSQPASVWDLHEFAPTPYFEGKFLLHFPAPAGIAGGRRVG
jgi:16S rRNA (guanine527-N7)-methyltransferase